MTKRTRRNRPELTNRPSGTHKGTEPERSVGPSSEIRQIRVPGVDRAFDGDNGKQMFSIYSESNSDRLDKSSSRLLENPCRIDRLCGNFG